MIPCSTGIFRDINAANQVAANLMSEGKQNVWIEVTRLASLAGPNYAYWAQCSTNDKSTYWVNYTQETEYG